MDRHTLRKTPPRKAGPTQCRWLREKVPPEERGSEGGQSSRLTDLRRENSRGSAKGEIIIGILKVRRREKTTASSRGKEMLKEAAVQVENVCDLAQRKAEPGKKIARGPGIIIAGERRSGKF